MPKIGSNVPKGNVTSSKPRPVPAQLADIEWSGTDGWHEKTLREVGHSRKNSATVECLIMCPSMIPAVKVY
ncbi:hypothetical protein E2P81_ATG03902 [Venturia nashicola]|uniref:Uncharacterized protein n=1 Tax=Venturia nashicola TaxID=86259 RepID=A0A4Z1PBS5_9PEZI|nr:hypothetical protein E6O75_ATG03994 [Venturia nashicola]TLD37090.1 hypothetical protein E2P81_ATG03902 [Venturia nashicola]